MKSVKVSDNFVSYIFKFIRNEKPDNKTLSISERQLLDHILYLAGLHKEVRNSSDKTIKHLKEQLDILLGQIQAGNNNPELYNQIKEVLYKMHHFKLITQNEVRKKLKEVKEFLD